MRSAGRTKQRLAKKLTAALLEAGYPIKEIEPESLMDATGYYRTSTSFQNESLRWEANVQRSDLPRLHYWLTSWTTMTELLKANKINLRQDTGVHIWVDVE